MEVLLGILVLGAMVMAGAELIPRAWAALDAWRGSRGRRVIVCPETGTCQVVSLERGHAARSAAFDGAAPGLSACTRWPERADCGQDCLAQIAVATDGCLLRSRLERWYAGRACVLCGERFGEIHWFDHKPGLLSPDRKPRSWRDLPVEDLTAAVETHEPLCWNCHISETFRTAHAERVIDDPWHRARTREAGRRVS